MSRQFDRINRLYDDGELSEYGVGNAVKKKFITAEEYVLIIGKEYID